MKQFALVIVVLLFMYLDLTAQNKPAFKYQAVIRDNTDNVLVNHSVSFRFSILQSSANGISVYSETQSAVTNQDGLVNLNIGEGTSTDSLTKVNWSANKYFLKVELDIAGGSNFAPIGTSAIMFVPMSLYSLNGAPGPKGDKGDMGLKGDTGVQGPKGVPGTTSWIDSTVSAATLKKVGIGTLTPYGILTVQGSGSITDSALFTVRDKNGQPVFTVYETGVAITYNTNPLSKGSRGGFTVGGRSSVKGPLKNILNMSTDSIRLYIDTTAAKGARGGFTVGGRTTSKGAANDYFSISNNSSSSVINPSKPTILWYPARNSLLVGQVLIESPDSVGTNSLAAGYESKAKGNYSQALGYRTIARGDYSTAIGNNAIANFNNSFAFGDGSQTLNLNSYAFGKSSMAVGLSSYAFGEGVIAGSSTASNCYAFGRYSSSTGNGSYAFGDGAVSSGLRSYALGSFGQDDPGFGTFPSGTYTIASGDNSFAAGQGSVASGDNSISIGFCTKSSSQLGIAMGYGSIASLNRSAIAIGEYTKSSGTASVAMGFWSVATGNSAISLGYGTRAAGAMSVAVGHGTTANANYSVVMGNGNLGLSNSVLEIGNGNFDGASGYKQNLLTILNNGSFELNVTGSDGYAGIAINNKNYSGKYLTINQGTPGKLNFTSPGIVDLFTLDFINNRVGVNTTSPNYPFQVNNGAYCTGLIWTNTSDKHQKENFTEVDGAAILGKIDELPILIWNYKKENSSIRHIGPMAQDFYAEFGLGNDTVSISTIDPAGISLAAIKELNKRNSLVQKEILNLNSNYNKLKLLFGSTTSQQEQLNIEQARNDEQQKQIDKLEKENEYLKKQVSELSGMKEDISKMKSLMGISANK